MLEAWEPDHHDIVEHDINAEESVGRLEIYFDQLACLQDISK